MIARLLAIEAEDAPRGVKRDAPRDVKRRDRDVDDDERPSKVICTQAVGAIAARAAVDAGLTRASFPEFQKILFALFDAQDLVWRERMARCHGGLRFRRVPHGALAPPQGAVSQRVWRCY